MSPYLYTDLLSTNRDPPEPRPHDMEARSDRGTNRGGLVAMRYWHGALLDHHYKG